MSTDPRSRITTIIPAYNAAKFLRRAIDSVLAQTLPTDELIVVDDGSKDNTAEVAESYGDRLICMRQPNGGVSVARNNAVKRATGRWMAFLDADDEWLPNRLESMMKVFATRPDAILGYSACYAVDLEGKRTPIPLKSPEELMPEFRIRCLFGPSQAIIDRQAYLEAGGFASAYDASEDWEMWFRLLARYGTKGFASSHEPVLLYYQTPGSLSQSKRFVECVLRLMDGPLLEGLTGMERQLFRRRIIARHCRDAAVYLRSQNQPEDLRYMMQSLAAWPFPDRYVQSDRYKLATHMLATSAKKVLLG